VGLGYWAVVSGQLADRGEGIHDTHPRLGWALKPGSTGIHASPGNFSVTYNIDSDGLRVVTNRGEARTRIWIFGDSFVFGHGVADADTLASRMARDWLAPGIHVVNAGVSGYGIAQQFQRLLELEDRIKPGDLVLFAPTSDDVERTFKSFRYPAQYLFREKSHGQIEVCPDLQNGALVTAQLDTPWNHIKALFYRALLTGRGLAGLHDVFYPPHALEEARTMVELARAAAAKRGARFALVILPRPEECGTDGYRADLSGLAFLDIKRFFPVEPREIAAIGFPTDHHWNARGHAIAAEAIVRTLLERGVLKPGEVVAEAAVNGNR